MTFHPFFVSCQHRCGQRNGGLDESGTAGHVSLLVEKVFVAVSSDPWKHEGVVSLLCGDDMFLVVILICEDHHGRVWILVHIDTNDCVVLQRWYLNPHFPQDCLWIRHGPKLQVRSRTGQTSAYTL